MGDVTNADIILLTESSTNVLIRNLLQAGCVKGMTVSRFFCQTDSCSTITIVVRYPMTSNQLHWKGKNKKTGEVCSHNHHSKEHAMRCAIAIYGDEYATACKRADLIPTGARIEKNNKRRAIKVHNEMHCNALGKENIKKQNRVKANTHNKKRKSIRGVVRFDKD